MDFGNALGSGIAGGFGLVGSGLNYLFNKRLAEQQNQFNIDMWKMQNEYNSPQSQMERFKAAGLNPNLIYGQGTSGNASSAPQMVTPQAPQFDEHMARLGQLFNIEGLKKLRAERREAEANASNAATNATRNEHQLRSEESFPNHYEFDLQTGRYVELPEPSDGVVVVRHPAATWTMDRLSRNYGRNFLVPFRANLLNTQRYFLAPQITMQNYNAKNYKTAYWIGQGRQIIGGFNDVISNFMPSKWLLQYKNPYGGIYYKAPWSGNIY